MAAFLKNKVNGLRYKLSRLLWPEIFKKHNPNPVKLFLPAGHYSSPIAPKDEVEAHLNNFDFNPHPDFFTGVSFNEDYQLELYNKWVNTEPKYPFLPEKSEAFRYYYNQHWFVKADSFTLYNVLNTFKPNKIFEIGSGFSTAVTLDTIKYLNLKVEKLLFIEPNTERLKSLIDESTFNKDTIELKEMGIQNVDPSIFNELKKDDILFIDGSHVIRPGNDFQYLLFNVLPKINEGVIIHIHDIFYPFEYLKSWIKEGRNWNELYVLLAFLMFNDKYEIIFFNHFMAKRYKQVAESEYFKDDAGGSFYFRKRISN